MEIAPQLAVFIRELKVVPQILVVHIDDKGCKVPGVPKFLSAVADATSRRQAAYPKHRIVCLTDAACCYLPKSPLSGERFGSTVRAVGNATPKPLRTFM